ncbi:MAG: SPOR domain-containing protein [Terracidiphilus sp.]
MRLGIGEEEAEQAEDRHDTELTLGPTMLLGIAVGLILLCGLCFWFGYSTGRRGASPSVEAGVQSTAGQAMQTQAGNSLSKPPAAGTIPSAPTQPAAAELPQPSSADGSPSGNPLTSYAPAGNGTGAESAQPLVRPALPQQTNGTQPVSVPAGGVQVQPAMAPGSGLMVQIAAVSHPEDANVLVAALRRRGYAVIARREPADSMIHVQIGPFSNRNDANAMCQRLLGDGYNAIVQP